MHFFDAAAELMNIVAAARQLEQECAVSFSTEATGLKMSATFTIPVPRVPALTGA